MGSVKLLTMLIDAPVSTRNLESLLYNLPIIMGCVIESLEEKILRQFETPVILKLFCAFTVARAGTGGRVFWLGREAVSKFALTFEF